MDSVGTVCSSVECTVREERGAGGRTAATAQLRLEAGGPLDRCADEGRRGSVNVEYTFTDWTCATSFPLGGFLNKVAHVTQFLAYILVATRPSSARASGG